MIKAKIESLKEVTKGAPIMILAWRCMKAPLMLKNECELPLYAAVAPNAIGNRGSAMVYYL